MSQKWMCVNMGMFVNPDNLAFQAALNAKIYVDKSGILNYTNSVLGSTDAFICNSRPRRFGKSVTANMLTAYYSKGCDSEEMFSRLKISQAEDFRKHLNQYDVIHWDIQWCMGPANGPEKVVSYISEKTISELREYYPDVLPAENHSLAETLARINTVTSRKFIVFIDEWDVLIRDEAAKEDIQNEYIRFLRGIFKGTEPTKYIQLAYLTGILPIKILLLLKVVDIKCNFSYIFICSDKYIYYRDILLRLRFSTILRNCVIVRFLICPVLINNNR